MRVSEEMIGKRVRSLRRARGLTLQELADKADISKSYLSRLETSTKAPPLSTLLDLAGLLGTTVGRLLGEEDVSDKISIVKKTARPEVTRSGSAFGYSYSSLVEGHPDKRLEAYVLELPREVGEHKFFEHRGEELLFVLCGEMVLSYGGMEYYLDTGDCAHFDSSVSHFGRSVGGVPTHLLAVFVTPDTPPLKEG